MYPVQMDQKQQAMSVVWPNRKDVVSPITQDTGMALEKQLGCRNGVGEKPVIKKKMKRRGRKGQGQMLQERKGYLNQVNDLTKSSPEKKNGMSNSEKARINVEVNRNCAIIQNVGRYLVFVLCNGFYNLILMLVVLILCITFDENHMNHYSKTIDVVFIGKEM